MEKPAGTRLQRIMRTLLLVTVFTVALPQAVRAVEARIESIDGNVEVRVNGGEWRQAELGMTLGNGSSISTSFNSGAVLELGPNTLRVRPLTRLTIDELIEREGVLESNLSLPVGRIRGEVRRTEGLQNEFNIRGRVATAAVRGTDFEFDGVNLRVFEGSVSLANRFGHAVSVDAGESSSTTGVDDPTSGVASLERDTSVSVSTRGVDGEATPTRDRPSTDGQLRVELEFGEFFVDDPLL